jgi:hypothetical protein
MRPQDLPILYSTKTARTVLLEKDAMTPSIIIKNATHSLQKHSSKKLDAVFLKLSVVFFDCYRKCRLADSRYALWRSA